MDCGIKTGIIKTTMIKSLKAFVKNAFLFCIKPLIPSKVDKCLYKAHNYGIILL